MRGPDQKPFVRIGSLARDANQPAVPLATPASGAIHGVGSIPGGPGRNRSIMARACLSTGCQVVSYSAAKALYSAGTKYGKRCRRYTVGVIHASFAVSGRIAAAGGVKRPLVFSGFFERVFERIKARGSRWS